MQENSMAMKIKAYWDGTEIQGLVNVGEITEERRTIEVPSFDRIRDIQSGIVKMPQIEFTYETRRGSETLQFFKDFYEKQEVKDVELVRTDAHGVEYERVTWTQCEIMTKTMPAYDAANPEFAKITFVVTPWDVIT